MHTRFSRIFVCSCCYYRLVLLCSLLNIHLDLFDLSHARKSQKPTINEVHSNFRKMIYFCSAARCLNCSHVCETRWLVFMIQRCIIVVCVAWCTLHIRNSILDVNQTAAVNKSSKCACAYILHSHANNKVCRQSENRKDREGENEAFIISRVSYVATVHRYTHTHTCK